MRVRKANRTRERIGACLTVFSATDRFCLFFFTSVCFRLYRLPITPETEKRFALRSFFLLENLADKGIPGPLGGL